MVRGALLVFLLATLGGAPVFAQEPELEGWAYDLADELMSPYCPGRSLAECPSKEAETLRMWLIVQESSGASKDEVMAELLDRFGDSILGAPRPEGFGLAAYVVPVLVFLGGGLLVAAFIRGQTSRSQAPEAEVPVASGPLDPELERLVEEDVAR